MHRVRTPIPWSETDGELIAWFNANRDRLPAEPFLLSPGVRVMLPERFTAAIANDIAAGPHGCRARNGALQCDLRRIRELVAGDARQDVATAGRSPPVPLADPAPPQLVTKQHPRKSKMQSSKLNRRDDPETAIAATNKILPQVSDLQTRILKAFREAHRKTGRGMTDGEIEKLPELADLGSSTASKRCTELRQLGYIRWTDEKRDSMKVSEPVPVEEMVDDIQRKQAKAAGRLF